VITLASSTAVVQTSTTYLSKKIMWFILKLFVFDFVTLIASIIITTAAPITSVLATSTAAGNLYSHSSSFLMHKIIVFKISI